MNGSDRDHASRTRDQAGIGPHATANADLVPLGKLDGIQVAEGDVDIRGWDVTTLSGQKVGTVHELLVDRRLKEIVMVDVDLTGSDRHTLAPIRAAQIDRTRRIVIFDSADLSGSAPASVAPVQGRTDDVSLRRPDALRGGAVEEHPVDETVVERRPVVYEEVVVRRKAVDPTAGDTGELPRDERP
jgi:hypothetical protein